ncbi:MAG TPA: Fe-S cluster assembly protein SufD [Stellaceae bacterium]|nr:Fe-S cluster assembly protein SufD [Stellaceae bacterium]
MIVKTETAPYVEAFAGRDGAGEPHWLAARRASALANFGDKGFPTRRQEAWRFTDLRLLQRAVFPPASGAGAPVPELGAWRLAGPAHRLVLVDGKAAPALSDLEGLPEGVFLASTAATLADAPDLVAASVEESDTLGNQPFASLNTAFFTDGFVLVLAPGTVLERPVEIVHLSTTGAPRSHHLRNLVRLGSGSRASLIETHAGAGGYWTNSVTALDLGDGAELHQARLQDEGLEAIHFALNRARLGRGARYRSFVLTLGARLSRQDMLVRFEGDGAELGLDGAYLLRGEQEATNATFIDHAAPGCTTRELFKGVVADRAHGVFLGSIGVRPEAQKTDAHQLNQNLLLSRRATVNTKPELEILADDVKCSHGATVGDLDEAALFYLLSRGIAEGEARRMLIEAFAAGALERIERPELRAHLTAHLERWLARGEETHR